MGELGVPDRYVDAFQGRIPKSVLARHYSDFAPDKLRAIYDRASSSNLSILMLLSQDGQISFGLSIIC